MNVLQTAVIAIVILATGWANTALAQRDPNKGVPVEFFACDWQDGKDMKDLDKVAKKFTAWAEENDNGYAAWILTPQFHADLGFDVGWLGSWPDFNAFGKSQDSWSSGGSDLGAAFDKVVDCSARHQMATSVEVNAPDGPPADGVVMFIRCSLKDGKTPVEALSAHREVAQAMKTLGSPASGWIFYPALGSGDVDFDYWSVLSFNSYAELGASQEIYVNGGGWEKVMGVLNPVTECQSPSVFDAKQVMAPPAS